MADCISSTLLKNLSTHLWTNKNVRALWGVGWWKGVEGFGWRFSVLFVYFCGYDYLKSILIYVWEFIFHNTVLRGRVSDIAVNRHH